eukprot:349836-Chlamydomonas_euryale.AAC.2
MAGRLVGKLADQLVCAAIVLTDYWLPKIAFIKSFVHHQPLPCNLSSTSALDLPSRAARRRLVRRTTARAASAPTPLPTCETWRSRAPGFR